MKARRQKILFLTELCAEFVRGVDILTEVTGQEL
jgi:hypothetical protein